MPGPIGEAFVTISPDLTGFDSRVLAALEESLRGIQSRADALSAALDAVDPQGLGRLSDAGLAAAESLDKAVLSARAADQAIGQIGSTGTGLTVDGALAEIRTIETASQAADAAVASIGSTPTQLSLDGALAEIGTVETASQAADAAVSEIGTTPTQLSLDDVFAEIARVEVEAQVADEAVAAIGDSPVRLAMTAAFADLDRLTAEAVNADQAVDGISGSPTINSASALADLGRVELAANQTDDAIESIGSTTVEVSTGGADAAISSLIASINRLDASLGSVPGAAGKTQAGLKGVGAEAGRTESGIRGLINQVNPLGSAFAKIGPRLKEIGFEAAAEQASAMVSAIGSGVKSLLTLGVQAAASAEQTKIAFEGLLGSAEEGTAFFEELQDFAAVTPFEFEGLAKSAQTFLALGQSTEDVITNLEAVGAAAAAAGASAESIDRVTVALAQIQGAGKLTADNLNQITDALPNVSRTAVYDVLAEKLGVTSGEVQKLSENGQILSEDAIPAIIEAFRRVPGAAGALEAQAQSLTGIFSTLKDTVKIELVTAFEPLTEVLREQATNVMPVLSEVLGELGEALGDVAADAIPLFIEGMSAFAPVIIEAVRQIGDFATDAGPSLLDFGATLLNVLEAAEPLREAFSGLLIANLDTFLALANALTPVLKALGTVLESIPAPLLSIFLTLKSFNSLKTGTLFQGLTTTLNATKAGFQGAAGAVSQTAGALTSASPVMAGFGGAAANATSKVGLATKATSGLAAGASSLGLAFNPVGLGIAAATVGAGLLVGEWQKAKAKTEEFKASVDQLAESFKTVIDGTNTTGNEIEKFVNEQIGDLSDGLREALADTDFSTEDFVNEILAGGDALDVFRNKADEVGFVLRDNVGKELELTKGNLARAFADPSTRQSVVDFAEAIGVTVEQLIDLVDTTEDWDNGAEEAAKKAVEFAEINGQLNDSQKELLASGAAYVEVLGASGTEADRAAEAKLRALLVDEKSIKTGRGLTNGLGELTDAQEEQIQALVDSKAPAAEWAALLEELDASAAIAEEANQGLGRSFRDIAKSIEAEAPAVAIAIANLGQQAPPLAIETFIDVAAANPEQFIAAADAIAEATGLTTQEITNMVEDASAAFENFVEAARSNLPAIGDEITALKDQVSAKDFIENLEAQAEAIENFNENVQTLLAEGTPEAVNAGLTALRLGPETGGRLAQELVDNIHGPLPDRLLAATDQFNTGFGVMEGIIKQGGFAAVTAAGVLGQDVVDALVLGAELNQDELREAYEQVRANAVAAGTKPPTKAEFDFAVRSGKKLPEAWITGAGSPIETMPGYQLLYGLPAAAAGVINTGTIAAVPLVSADGTFINAAFGTGLGDPATTAANEKIAWSIPMAASAAIVSATPYAKVPVQTSGYDLNSVYGIGLGDPAATAANEATAWAIPMAASAAIVASSGKEEGPVKESSSWLNRMFGGGLGDPEATKFTTAAAAALPVAAATAVTAGVTAQEEFFYRGGKEGTERFTGGLLDPAAQTGLTTAVTGVIGSVSTALSTAAAVVIPAAEALGRSLVDQFAVGLRVPEAIANLRAAAENLGAIVTLFATSGLRGVNGPLRQAGVGAARAVATGLGSAGAAASVRSAGARLGRQAAAGIASVGLEIRVKGTAFAATATKAISSTLDLGRASIQAAGGRAAGSAGVGIVNAAAGVVAAAKVFGATVTINLVNSLNTGNAAVKAAGAAAAGAFATGTKSATALVAVRSSAYALRDGFYQVLTDPAFLGRLYDAGAAWARKVNAGIEAFALIASPSRLMIEQGQFLAEGFLIGVQDPATLASLGGAGESLASAVTSSLDVSTVGASLFDSVADGFSAQAGTTGLAVPIEPVTLAVSPLVAEVPPLSPVDLPVKPAVGPIVIPDLAPVTVPVEPLLVEAALQFDTLSLDVEPVLAPLSDPAPVTVPVEAAVPPLPDLAPLSITIEPVLAPIPALDLDPLTPDVVLPDVSVPDLGEATLPTEATVEIPDLDQVTVPVLPVMDLPLPPLRPVSVPVLPILDLPLPDLDPMTVTVLPAMAPLPGIPAVEATVISDRDLDVGQSAALVATVQQLPSQVLQEALAAIPALVPTSTTPTAQVTTEAAATPTQATTVTFEPGSIVVNPAAGMTADQARTIGEGIGSGISRRLIERSLTVTTRTQ